MGAGLILQAPRFDLDFTAQADSNGVCGGIDLAGIQFGVDLGAELDGFGGYESVSDLSGQFGIVNTSTSLFSSCIGIAGAAPAAAAKA